MGKAEEIAHDRVSRIDQASFSTGALLPEGAKRPIGFSAGFMN